MATILSDTCTDTTNTTLQSHTPDTGSAWAKHSASGGDMVIESNRVRNGSSSVVFWYTNGVSASSADYSVEADMFVVSVAGEMGIGLRFDTTAQTGYFCNYFTGAGWKLYKAIAGSHTQLGSTVSQTLTVGQTYHLKVTATGTTIAALVDGSQIISVTDSAISATGKPGLRGFDFMNSSTGIHLDNIVATDASVTGRLIKLSVDGGVANLTGGMQG